MLGALRLSRERAHWRGDIARTGIDTGVFDQFANLKRVGDGIVDLVLQPFMRTPQSRRSR